MLFTLSRRLLTGFALAAVIFHPQTALAQEAAVPAAQPSVLVLDPTEKVWSLQLTAKSRLVVEKGDVVVNSTHEHALWNAASALDVQTGTIKVAGGVNELGEVSINPRPQTGAAPVSDPVPAFRVTPPTPVSNQKLFLKDAEVTLRPGIYTDGIFSGGHRKVHLEPGVYVMNGGDFFFSDAAVTGEGVTIVLAGEKPGGFWTAAGTRLNLTPPQDGPLKGIVILSRAEGWNRIQIGQTEGRIQGLIYAPKAGLSIGHKSTVTVDRIICANLGVSAESALTVTGAPVELAAPTQP